MLPLIGAAITGVIEVVKSIGGAWMEKKKVEAAGKIAITQAKIDAQIKREEQQGQMDINATEDMRFSWKDELLTLWTLGVLTACFVPQLQPYVKEGFIFLRDCTPEWFGWCVVGMYAAIFGLRTWMGWKKSI